MDHRTPLVEKLRLGITKIVGDLIEVVRIHIASGKEGKTEETYQSRETFTREDIDALPVWQSFVEELREAGYVESAEDALGGIPGTYVLKVGQHVNQNGIPYSEFTFMVIYKKDNLQKTN